MLRRFGLGPVFVYESLLASRRWQVYAGRSLFVFVMLVGMAIVWIGNSHLALKPGTRQPTLQMMAKVGQGFFYALAGIQISLVMLAAPAAAAGAVCMDRARGSLLHMLVTDLSDAEIVLGKLGARLTPIIGMIACGVPVAALAALLGGIDFGALAGAFVVSLALTVFGCVLALAISVWAAKTHEVLMAVYMIEGIWLLSIPFWWALAGPRVPPAWLEKSHPFVLVFAPYNKPGFVSAVDYAVFVGVLLALSAMLVALTIARLRAVVVQQSGRPEKAGRRLPERVARLFPTLAGPSLDGNPVLWREWHRNRPSRLAGRIWGSLTVVTALLAAWGTYDLVIHGYSPSGPGGLGLAMILTLIFGFLMLSATAPTALAEERVRGSLDVLLATPLSTRSIVAGKWWGAYRRVFVLAPILLYAVILMAATSPATHPAYVKVVRLPYKIVPLHLWERILAPVLSCADFFASGALLVSVGIALATWVRRLSRAVAVNVIAFLVLAIGLPILFETLFSQFMLALGPNSWLSKNPWVMMSLMSFSPIVGPVHPLDILFDYSMHGRASQWICAGVIALIKTIAAAILFSLTVKTFDRCLGRVSETKFSSNRTGEGDHDRPEADSSVGEDDPAGGLAEHERPSRAHRSGVHGARLLPRWLFEGRGGQ
jgi:ABC-type transport system involved in multi-copper enzyme maturation permease subunit